MTFMINRRRLIAGTAQASCAMVMASLGGSIVRADGSPERHSTDPLPGANATPRQVAESYWRAESERDVERVGQHYHHDAVFIPPGERLVGWDNIRKWYEATYRRFSAVKVEIVHEISRGDEAALEWKANLTDATGVVYTPIGVNIVRVEGGKFREVRAYFDPTIAR